MFVAGAFLFVYMCVSGYVCIMHMGIIHKEQSLTLIIITISGNLTYQQEGYYFKKKNQKTNNNNKQANKNTVAIFSSKFLAGLIIFIEIVDFRHTVQMQVTWVPGKLQS